MRRPQIVERIRKALLQVAPGAQAILYGSEARGDARILLKKIWENRPFKTPFYVNVANEGIIL